MRLIYLFLMIWILIGLPDSSFAAKAHSKKRTTATKKVKVTKKITVKRKITKRIITSTVSVPATLYGAGQLANSLNQIISANQGTDIAVYVKSMVNGDTLYAYNINQPLTPASTLKVLTAEAALLYLGPEYRFSTQLLTDAKTVRNGILEGNLYIVLSGDPSLTYYDLTDLLLNLKSQQIQAVAGNIYIDHSAFDQSYYGPGWLWKDKSYCYGAPISASIINHNCLSFQVTPSKIAGHSAQVVTSPKYFYPGIRNSVITKAGKPRCAVHLSTNPSSVIAIDGCMPRGGYAWGVSYVVTDIHEYNRALFKTLLNRLGINIYGNVGFGSAPRNSSLVAQHSSKPLRLLINEMLKKSDNIIAGALFKKIGQLYTRTPGSWQNGSYAVSQILSRQAGVNTSGLKILDGSGLSPDNLTTPSQMMQVLDFAYHHYPTSFEFVSALPIAGVDGTLKHRMPHIARKVRAKTGTISGVVSLAGYTESANKEPLAFVIMINGNKGMGWQYKTIEDRIVTALTRYVRT